MFVSLINKIRWGFSAKRPATPKQKRVRRGFLPRLESLEDRTVPSTFTVTTLAASGAGSLQAAVASGDATINFAGNVRGVIALTGELQIDSSVTINGPG